MNSLLHRDGDDDLDEINGTRDREITLGTTMILAIFFALAVLCAIFFGFGYQMGHKTAVTEPPIASTVSQSGSGFAGFKPAAGSPTASTPNNLPGPTVAVPYPSSPPATVAPAPRSVPTSAQEPAAAEPSTSTSVSTPVPHPVPAASTSNPVVSTSAPAGPEAIVQVAAVSHQEDADLLVTTLKRRGYNVAIRTEPQDKLLHVQVGPFPSHKDADAMRQKLLADGFNAIVKEAR